MLDLTNHMVDDENYNGKTLAERMAGRFYTPTQLAEDLAEQMVAAAETPSLTKVLAMDPFCGDGRLIVALLFAAAKNAKLRNLPWIIELRDRDEAATRTAIEHVHSAASHLDMTVETCANVGDTFTSDLAARCDFVITNPPWELLKPDSREIKHLSAAGAKIYKEGLRITSRQLNERFPDARADNAWGGWGTNLARCGWDFCLRVARKGGIVGIVLPATILGDQSSSSMRRRAFESNSLLDAAAFPSEARLFDRVDQPVVALTMRTGVHTSGQARIRYFDADRRPAGEQMIALAKSTMEARGWSLPVGRPTGIDDILFRFEGLAPLHSWEGERPTEIWLGRELDETRISEKISVGTRHPFVKGRMVGRHQVVEHPTMSVHPALCLGFHSASKPRAVWRDVARATSKRRMIGTVIPAGWIVGNSLHVACFRDGNRDRTLALHALLSSLVVEAQVRARLTTGHMSLGVVRQARMPPLDDTLVHQLSSLAQKAINIGSAASEHRLEIAVAKAYGLERDDMMRMLDDFPKLDDRERRALTNSKNWSE